MQAQHSKLYSAAASIGQLHPRVFGLYPLHLNGKRYKITTMQGRELEFIDWLQALPQPNSHTKLGIGDDMAILSTPAGDLLTASDMLLDGVHFDSNVHDYGLIGRKAVAVNLSDCAAMAARPIAVTTSVAWPHNLNTDKARQVFAGMQEIAGKFDVALAGGDTTSWDKPLAIDVAIIAVPFEDITPVQRNNAQEGDTLYVTGRLGGSLLGRHLAFSPRVREAEKLGRALGDSLHAMIDLSDGLSLDLARICKASGVGAVLEEKLIDEIVSDDARALAGRDGSSPFDHALNDGEDFELLLAASREVTIPGVPLYPIGRIVGEGLHLRQSDGLLRAIDPRGYVH